MRDEIGHKEFFVTPDHRCSYLPNRDARTLFLDPRETLTQGLYEQLTQLGFRRSGGHLYRPHCKDCSACVPVRLPVKAFRYRRRYKRVLTRASSLTMTTTPGKYSGRHFSLYAKYIKERHFDGDMYPPTADQFRSFLLSTWSDTQFLNFYEGDELVAVAVTDRQADGLSAIYTFYDPSRSELSLGVYCLLKQIELCVAEGRDYLYLGYWIQGCNKMSYKLDFRPIELFRNNKWVYLD